MDQFMLEQNLARIESVVNHLMDDKKRYNKTLKSLNSAIKTIKEEAKKTIKKKKNVEKA